MAVSDVEQRTTASVDAERAAWIGFNLVSGVGPVRTERLLDVFGTLAEAWAAPPERLRTMLDERTLGRLTRVSREGQVHRTIERLDETGIRVVIRTDPDYPERLTEIPAPPPILYLRGDLLAADRHAVAIVGTRRMTAYGRDVTARIAAGLAEAGVTVVSGLALGIDGVAHRAALDAGGRTVGVKGCGVNVPYPAAHVRMADEMAGSGAVVSEYAPDRKPEAANFPARNRIISGLSLGTVVIEAPERSGALITVSFALDHGREVFVVPGDVRSEMSAGCNALLRDGARPVRSADDILADLNLAGRHAPVAIQPALPLGDAERTVLDALRAGPMHIDEIAVTLGQPVFQVATQLMMLELDGRVRNTGGQVYAGGW
ncbi:MAG TPA: DNA-processing protein DprA [Thermomicrobiales bacterium]|jgi:DNA processing protein|nr:DNA-processing protein DprA [Thermomicrobiales bacterium]